jgi:NAD(P)H-hydrate repair Nnr-like enzyme with NAD(P)H-hydrate epimerase domain
VKVRVIDAAMRPPLLPACDLVIDAAYGTGFRGEWIAPDVVSPSAAGRWCSPSTSQRRRRADRRAGDGVLAADRTVTFQALKPGLLFGAAAS